MTSPDLAAGGRSVTIGRAPVLLTEYGASLTVINTSLADSVWLAGSSSVGPGSGVPVSPGTSYTWSTPGPLYAILDPSAGADVTLIITGSGTNWSPSPAAVGAAVAAELTTQGVPSKLLIEPLAYLTIPPSGTQYVDGISGYASINVVCETAQQIALQWDGGPQFYIFANAAVNNILPVLGNHLSINNTSNTDTIVVTVTGYNKYFGNNLISYGTNNSPYTEPVTLPAGSPYADAPGPPSIQGLCYLSVDIGYGDNNIIPWSIQLGALNNQISTELTASSHMKYITGREFKIYQLVSLPPSVSSLSVVADPVAPTADVSFEIIITSAATP